MNDFISSAVSRHTSVEIMTAIAAVAGTEVDAVRVWEAPTYEEALAVWERVTGNGARPSTDYHWGVEGSQWAAALGISG